MPLPRRNAPSLAVWLGLALVFNAFTWGVSWWPLKQLNALGIEGIPLTLAAFGVPGLLLLPLLAASIMILSKFSFVLFAGWWLENFKNKWAAWQERRKDPDWAGHRWQDQIVNGEEDTARFTDGQEMSPEELQIAHVIQEAITVWKNLITVDGLKRASQKLDRMILPVPST